MKRRLATFSGAVLGTLSAVFFLALGAHAANGGPLTEEFHQTYSIVDDGRVDLDNINGPVHITSWDRNEVKVDAVKSAWKQERLDEVKIEVDAAQDHVSIHTKYKEHDHTFNWGSHDNPATVEYTITVPRKARLDEIKLVNGKLDVSGVSGEVRASCVNGKLEARDLSGRAHLSTVNGRLDAQFASLSGSTIDLNSVNGSLDLTIPSDSKAEIEASTVSGGIDNDFGLHVNNHQYVGHDLHGQLGSGGTRIKLSNVNGHIAVHHAQDGHAMSPVKDSSHGKKEDDDDDDDSSI